MGSEEYLSFGYCLLLTQDNRAVIPPLIVLKSLFSLRRDNVVGARTATATAALTVTR